MTRGPSGTTHTFRSTVSLPLKIFFKFHLDFAENRSEWGTKKSGLNWVIRIKQKSTIHLFHDYPFHPVQKGEEGLGEEGREVKVLAERLFRFRVRRNSAQFWQNKMRNFRLECSLGNCIPHLPYLPSWSKNLSLAAVDSVSLVGF